ncbi:cardiolipin synthase [Novosphingobium hassiacum]|uniref:Phospholipase D n=1 Tax=Novosphingobium hassiacum TaxID=173676 RepID=A0A7W6EUW1_9SPHN|nr:phosphatidylserine/phosphatidylglycerophosphate/cardiolipin synthase family protein [Novosphingobium hassiacum]MBB3859668.1 cardiolipin synthase [Novosphingobium hassiacum]
MTGSTGRYQLLVGSAAFWAQASADLAAASSRVAVQAMTFEADAAGRSVADAILGSHAASRRVLVDDYSRNVINDTMLPLPFRPAEVVAEARATLAMFDAMNGAGVPVRVTNPVLGHLLRYPLRNHKKLLVMDDVAHIGGINFSDHNFAWADLMLRIEDQEIADFLVRDFDNDWAGTPRGVSGTFGDIELVCFDGDSNDRLMQPLIDLVASARRSVEMVSAYPTMPFVGAMAQAARNGAQVTIYSPAPNNKPVIRDYLAGVAGPAGIHLRLLPEMTHAKALLIDGDTLVLGSSNFNFASHRTSSDIVAVVRNAALIADFEARLLGPARASSFPIGEARIPAWRQWRARAMLELADKALANLRHGPVRAMDWKELCAPRQR